MTRVTEHREILIETSLMVYGARVFLKFPSRTEDEDVEEAMAALHAIFEEFVDQAFKNSGALRPGVDFPNYG